MHFRVDKQTHLDILRLLPHSGISCKQNEGIEMDKRLFQDVRLLLKKTQKQLADLLGISVKAIHSYEQGWRPVPDHIHRQLFFLLTQKNDNTIINHNCWQVLNCPSELKSHCPAYEYHAGNLCWYMNGTLCHGESPKTFEEKIRKCLHCDALHPAIANIHEPELS